MWIMIYLSKLTEVAYKCMIFYFWSINVEHVHFVVQNSFSLKLLGVSDFKINRVY